MASSVNKVILVGRLGADPEIKKTANGASVANLRLATSESWKDSRSGEKKEKTEWHRVTVWNEHSIDKFIEPYLRKGDLVYVEGKIETRKWQDQEGVDKFSTEVIVPAFGGAISLLQSKDGPSGDRNNSDDRGSDDRSSSRGNSRSGSNNARSDDRGSDGRGSGSGSGSGNGGGRSRARSDDSSGGRGDDNRVGGGNDSGNRGGGQRSVASGGGGRRDMDDEIPF